MAGSYEHVNDPSGSIRGMEFRDYVDDSKLLKNDSAQWY
jgi:hypothetical protein